jgi:hypothetical protein
MIVCIIIIFIYGKLRCKYQFKDPLQYKIPIWDLDGWSVSHLIFYGFIGYLYPDYLITVMICGILWEIFEFCYGYYKPNYLKIFDNCITTDQKEKWWYGKFSDLIVNLLGFIVGSYLGKNIIK